MSLNADTIEYLLSKGLTGEDLLEVARRSEKRRDPTNAERQARFKAKKRTKSNGVTVTDVTPPNDSISNPPSPSEPNGSSGETASDDADVQVGVEILLPQHVVDEWNTVAGRLAKPRVRDLTPERRQLVRARIAQYSIDDFVDVFGKVERSPFLRGETGGWGGCTFDWIMKKGNFQKILEGNYDQ